MAKFRKATPVQIAMAYRALEEHGTVVKEPDGFKWYVYETDWSDERVSESTGAPVSGVSVLRRQNFGDLKRRGAWALPKEEKHGRETNPPPITADVEALVARVQALARVVSDQGARLAVLEGWARDLNGGDL